MIIKLQTNLLSYFVSIFRNNCFTGISSGRNIIFEIEYFRNISNTLRKAKLQKIHDRNSVSSRYITEKNIKI